MIKEGKREEENIENENFSFQFKEYHNTILLLTPTEQVQDQLQLFL